MAAVNFPNSPSVNDTHTSSGSTWKWDGGVWQRLGEVGPQGAQGVQGAQGHQGVQGAQGHQGHQGKQGTIGAQGATNNLTIAVSPPGSPTAGDLWWDSDDGDLHTYFNDGNSSQWISINNGPAGAQGAQGVQGAQGHQGHQGRQGATGSTGAAGAQGAQGHQGHQGVQGAAGSTTTINNNANNRVITGSGSANTLEGESQLLFTGTNLGVGDRTSSPDEKLHVHTGSGAVTIHAEGATHANLNLRSHSGDSTIKFSDAAATNIGNINYDHGSDLLSFRVNGSDRLAITSGGNIDVNGTPPWTVTGGDWRNLSISGQTSSSSGFLWLGNGAAATNADFDLARINVCNAANIVAQIVGSTQTAANDDGRLTFWTKATGGSLTERWRIRSNGHLESNNTNLYLLRSGTTGDNDICFGDSGDDDIGRIRYDHDDNSLQFLVNTAERIRIKSDGKVGINDSSPDSILSVKDTYIFSCAGGNSTTGMQIGGYDAGANSYNPITVRASQILFSISGTEKARISSAGRLAIGTVSPDKLLHIADNTNDAIVLEYTGTTGGHESQIQFHDFRGQTNALICNELYNDQSGQQTAHLFFKTAHVGTLANRLKIVSTGEVIALGDSTDTDFKNQNYPSESAGIRLQNWPSSNTTGAFVSNTFTVKAGNGTAQIGAWTAQSTASGTVPDMYYSVRDGNNQQHIMRIGGTIGRNVEITNNVTMTGGRNSNIVNERLFIMPSENDGYDDSHMLSAAQTAGNWEEGAGTSNYDSSFGWLWQYAANSGATKVVRAGIAYDHKGSEEFKYWSSYGAHTWYVDSGKSGDETAETCTTKAQQINFKGSVVSTANQPYGIYTRSSQTPNGGDKTVQYLYDCYGEWAVVAKIQQSSHMQSTMSSVAQIDTSTNQQTGTEWSSSFGDSYPSEVRFVSSTDYKHWRDNRGVDFIYGVPNGRQWKKFLTDGGTSGMTHGGNNWGNNNRWGFTVAGGYDGFGRYHNPNYVFMRMSDGNTTIADTFFTTAGQTIDLDTANDAKFSFHATAVSSGQDCDNHQTYGYDDNNYGHSNTYPATFSNHGGADLTASPLWICLKFDHSKEN